jgi:hypothetical protein
MLPANSSSTSPITSTYNLQLLCRASSEDRNAVADKRMSSMLAKMTVRAFSSREGRPRSEA